MTTCTQHFTLVDKISTLELRAFRQQDNLAALMAKINKATDEMRVVVKALSVEVVRFEARFTELLAESVTCPQKQVRRPSPVRGRAPGTKARATCH